MSATTGKVALVNNATLLTGSCPTALVDFVGYGPTANCSETAPTAVLSNTTAALRKSDGAQDTDNNSTDFTIGAPNPRNTPPPEIAPSVLGTIPADGAASVPVGSDITVTFSEPVNVAGTWFTLSCSVSGAHTATVTGGPTTFTLNPDADFGANDLCTLTILALQVSDQDFDEFAPDNLAANFTFTFVTLSPAVKVRKIQGAGHISPRNGLIVGGVVGVVTGKSGTGFWMQDGAPDADDATSEGIFVFSTTAAASVTLGDAVRVSGRVAEFRPGAAGLTITELTSPTVVVTSSEHPAAGRADRHRPDATDASHRR